MTTTTTFSQLSPLSSGIVYFLVLFHHSSCPVCNFTVGGARTCDDRVPERGNCAIHVLGQREQREHKEKNKRNIIIKARRQKLIFPLSFLCFFITWHFTFNLGGDKTRETDENVFRAFYPSLFRGFYFLFMDFIIIFHNVKLKTYAGIITF